MVWSTWMMAMIGAFASPNMAHAGLAQTTTVRERGMFSAQDFDRLRFLEGRWSGKMPDGSPFYEAYDFPSRSKMRSRRYPDANFTMATDGSVVDLQDGEVISRWGEFTWKAAALEDGKATFQPLNAPSAFTWRRLGPDAVEVTQNWTDEKGMAQTYSLTLKRVGTPE